MKIYSKHLRVLLLLILSIYVSFAYATDNLDQEVQSTMRDAMHEFDIPGAAVVVYKDGQMHQYLFGVMNKKTKAPVTAQTIFELGSVTKSFVGLLLAKQVNSGTMNLNDNLVKYLDPQKTYSNSIQRITLLELATHTSALPFNIPNLSYNAATNQKNDQLFNQYLQTWQAPYPPGTAELYSNFGFALLGYALTSSPKTNLTNTMQTEILQPLKMQNSYLSVPANLFKYYAQGYSAQGAPARTPAEGMLGGAWAMKSTINDMAKYLSAVLGLSGIPNQIVNAIKTAQSGYFQFNSTRQLGLGWTIIPLSQLNTSELLKLPPITPRKQTANAIEKISSPQYNSNALIEKTGATNGFRAYIGVIPEKKLGIVILTNKFTNNPHSIEHAGRKIIFSQ